MYTFIHATQLIIIMHTILHHLLIETCHIPLNILQVL